MKILFHFVFAAILCMLMIYFINKSGCSDLSDYISAVGSAASIYGILITLWQLHLAKNKAMEYHNQLKEEVTDARMKIKSGLAISIVENAIHYLSEAIEYVSVGNYELVKIRMEDCEPLISEIKKTKVFFTSDGEELYNIQYWKFREALYTVHRNYTSPNKINGEIVVDSLSKMRSVLIDIKTNIKQSLYE